MTKLVMNADLFRIAYACVSTEETRYYLNGVQVERHPQRGLLYIATDGHRLLVVHDENATALDLPRGGVILQADKTVRKQLAKPKGKDWRRMTVTMSDSASKPHICELADIVNKTKSTDEYIQPVASVFLAQIDGSFPDWRRVVPRLTEQGPVGVFNGAYLEDFAAVGNELTKYFNKGERVIPMSINGQGNDMPALVSWANRPALGVLMPIRGSIAVFPTWLETAGRRQETA